MNVMFLIILVLAVILALVFGKHLFVFEKKAALSLVPVFNELVAQAKEKNIEYGPFLALDVRGFATKKSNRPLVVYADKDNLHLIYQGVISSNSQGLSLNISQLRLSSEVIGLVKKDVLSIELPAESGKVGFYKLHSLTNDPSQLNNGDYFMKGIDAKQQVEGLKNYLLAHGAQEK